MPSLCFSKAGPFPKQFVSVLATQAQFNVLANKFSWYLENVIFLL
jgi:hypothetical protein